MHYVHDHNRRVQIYTKVYNQESDLDAQDKVFKVGPWFPSPGDCNRLCDVGMVSQVMAGVLQRTRLCGEILVDWGKYTEAISRIITQLRMLAASLAATHAELACLRCVSVTCGARLPCAIVLRTACSYCSCGLK